MLDNLKAQLKNKDTFVKMAFYNYHRSLEASSLANDLYPFLMEYYHELNPAFLNNINQPELIDMFPAITVRDGDMLLANFILKYFQQIPKMKTHFFIHQDLAYLVPANLRAHFSAWNIVHSNSFRPQEASRILIGGVINDTTLNLVQLKQKLNSLGVIRPQTQIDIYLPQRQNLFGMPWTESNLAPRAFEIIKDHFPENKIHFIKTKELIDSAGFSSTYFLDLFSDSPIVKDSYLNHFVVARGGSTSGFKSVNISDCFFEIDLSFHHKIQYFPLPEVTSIFPELIFFKKQATSRELMSDPSFQLLFKKKNL